MSAFIVEPILGAGMIVPPDGYLAGDPRGLRPLRRALDRRRGHDRRRADGLVPAGRRAGRRARPRSSWPRPSAAATRPWARCSSTSGSRRRSSRQAGASTTCTPTAAIRCRARSGWPSSTSSSARASSSRRGAGASTCATRSRAPSSDLGVVGEVRGAGLASGVEYVRDPATREAYPETAGVARSIWEGMLERGYIMPSLHYQGSDLIGDFSYLTPAFVITRGPDRRSRGRAAGHDRGRPAGLVNPASGGPSYPAGFGRTMTTTATSPTAAPAPAIR